jgi:hypothetical protein
MILNLVVAVLLMFTSGPPKRGYTIWISPCGYSYYLTETDDGLPALMGNTRTFGEAQAIVDGQAARDDELRRRLRKSK